MEIPAAKLQIWTLFTTLSESRKELEDDGGHHKIMNIYNANLVSKWMVARPTNCNPHFGGQEEDLTLPRKSFYFWIHFYSDSTFPFSWSWWPNGVLESSLKVYDYYDWWAQFWDVPARLLLSETKYQDEERTVHSIRFWSNILFIK